MALGQGLETGPRRGCRPGASLRRLGPGRTGLRLPPRRVVRGGRPRTTFGSMAARGMWLVIWVRPQPPARRDPGHARTRDGVVTERGRSSRTPRWSGSRQTGRRGSTRGSDCALTVAGVAPHCASEPSGLWIGRRAALMVSVVGGPRRPVSYFTAGNAALDALASHDPSATPRTCYYARIPWLAVPARSGVSSTARWPRTPESRGRCSARPPQSG